MRAQHGLSLIELLVALTVSLILMSGVLAVMSSTKKTSALQDELSRLQEDARFLMEDLSYNVRMAGYFGCSSRIPSSFTFTPPSLFVENNKELRDVDDKIVTRSTPRSDILTVSHFAASGKLRLDYPTAQGVFSTTTSLANVECTDLNTPTPEGATPLVYGDPLPNWCLSTSVTDINLCQEVIAEKNYVKSLQCAGNGFSTNNNFIDLHADSTLPEAGDQVIITDCAGSELYDVVSLAGTRVTLQPQNPICGSNLCRSYSWPIDVFHLPVNPTDGRVSAQRVQMTYQVKAIDKDGNGKSNDSIDGFGLFKNDQLFIEGVESLQVRYGIDTNSDSIVDRYIEATPNPLGNIISVRITLLMRTANKRFDLTGSTNREFSLDPDLPNSGLYNPNDDANIDQEEGYRHRLFTTTIRVRNS